VVGSVIPGSAAGPPLGDVVPSRAEHPAIPMASIAATATMLVALPAVVNLVFMSFPFSWCFS
jgi:hypothetical protein